MTADDVRACPFCGHAGPFDQWPCEWLDGSGANVIRCPMCHGAAPMKSWNYRHLTQSAQAVDVGAEWRPFYAAVIQSIAVLARARTIDDGPREAILRETVMGEVTRIRAALDRLGKTMTTAALAGKQP